MTEATGAQIVSNADGIALDASDGALAMAPELVKEILSPGTMRPPFFLTGDA